MVRLGTPLDDTREEDEIEPPLSRVGSITKGGSEAGVVVALGVPCGVVF